MQKNLVSLTCVLALLAVLMPAIIAEESQNVAANVTQNETLNATANVTQNETLNATANITLNATDVVTEDDIPESVPNVTKMSAQNATSHTKVLRAGFEKTKPLNNLDVYGNKSTYNIPSSTSPGPAFNISQRLGNVSKTTYNTDIYKPTYNISQYSRTKPLYEVPDTLSSKPVYSISGYPLIKAANSIP
ncbi:MAG: hypothetical protein JW999_00115 [Methanotrichaceae archaeon]|nr:hypothetical protein [Methanotrichaceae archaeon]